MEQYTVLITGANRGIGLGLAHFYAECGWSVLATCRQPNEADALQKLAQQYSNLKIDTLDVTQAKDIALLKKRLIRHSIDVLINNAAIYGDPATLAQDKALWLKTFETNTIAPLELSQALLSNIESSKKKLIINISSQLGSISNNQNPHSTMLRSSKAALNAVMHNLALDLKEKNITVLNIHPGCVPTDMSKHQGDISLEESVRGIAQCIGHASLAQTGQFISYRGKTIPW